MIPILVLKTENKVIYNKSNLNCKTFFEEFIWGLALGGEGLGGMYDICSETIAPVVNANVKPFVAPWLNIIPTLSS